MSEVGGLLREYTRQVNIPWPHGLAGPQKVWCAIYDPSNERRLRLHVPEFELATRASGHDWRLVDVTDSFARWMAAQEYRDAYFAEPDYLHDLMAEFGAFVTREVEAALTEDGVDRGTVVALLGAGALFGLIRASALIEAVAPRIRGRLLVFFPGHHEGTNYRLLDARDGWNYQAIAIKASQGA